MGHTWKTKEETFHGSKWGYVVVVLVIAIVLSLLGSIFYLVGEGIKGMNLDGGTILSYSLATVLIIVVLFILALISIKVGWMAMATLVGFFSHIHGLLAGIWTIFSNIYMLVLTVILTVVLLLALSVAVYTEIPISFSNPLVIGILIVLFIIFIPFAIFIIDMFSYEHE